MPLPLLLNPRQSHGRGSAFLLFVCFALSAAAASTVSADEWWRSEAVGLGPILLRSQSPPSLLRLTPTPLAPVVLREGEWQAGSVVSWNNYLAIDPDRLYLIDAESVGVTLGAIYGFADRADLSLTLPVSYRGGGILDAFIEQFEEAVGQLNQDRLLYDHGRYLVRIKGPDGGVVERNDSHSGWGLEDPVLTARWQILSGDEHAPALLLSSGFKIPVGDRTSLRSSGGVDVSLGLGYGQRFGRFHGYASLGGIRYATTNIAGVDLERVQWSLFSGLEYRKSPLTSWLLQLVLTSPAAKDFGGFSDATYELTIGIRRRIGSDLLLELAVLENLFIFDNSPDVGFHVGLVKRF